MNTNPLAMGIKQKKVIIFSGFAIIYMLVSFVNHYMLRTNAHDFGIYNQALYDYAHFRINNNTVLSPNFGNLLSDHFEILIMLISPLYYLFGSYTLLIVQIVGLMIGGQGIFKYVESINNNPKPALAATIHFFAFYGIFSALAFDFHNNVLGAMAVPWIFYFLHKEQWRNMYIALLILLLSKENMALWGFFIFVGLMVQYRKNRKKLIYSSIAAIVSIVYFLVVVKVVIPILGSSRSNSEYLHFRYAILGSNMSESIQFMLSHPWETVKLLFVNHLDLPTANYVKAELHLTILISGGLLLFYRPYYFIMLLPLYGQKLFCDLDSYWGLGYHYNVEFAPILTIGAFTIIQSFTKEKTRRIVIYLLLFLTAAMTFRSFDHTYTFFHREKQRIYQAAHYQRKFDVSEAYKAMKLIPDTAAVCAQEEFVPHLSFRKKIYLYPETMDAQYIFLCSKAKFYPFEKEEQYAKSVANLDSAKIWVKIYDKNAILVYKRK